MPVIPQYNASGPAQQQGPKLQRTGGVRLDASQQLNALSGLSNQIQNGIKPIGGVSANPSGALAAGQANIAQGSASFASSSASAASQEGRGLQSLGQGVKAFGQALFNIRESEATARNYADVHAAQMEMDEAAGAFEVWKEKNPDPRGWVRGWEDQSQNFLKNRGNGKDIAPAAQRVIQQKTDSFISQQAIRTDVQAIKATTQQARESLMANYERAVESQNMEEAAALSEYGVKQGWIGEDDGVKMQFHAQDVIESKQIEQLTNQKKTALLYGDTEGALEAIEAMPIREDERALMRAGVTEQVGYNLLIEKAEDVLDPIERIELLDSEEFDKLRPSDRQKLIDASYREANEESVGAVAGIKEEIALGQISQPTDMEGREDFEALPEREQEALRQYFKQGAQNDIAEFMTLQRTIRGYDPANDPRGFEKAQYEQAIALRFEGERAGELFQSLADSSDPGREPVSASARVVSDIFKVQEDRFKAGEFGDYRIKGDDIEKIELESGAVEYRRILEKRWGKDLLSDPIRLSESDEIKFEDAAKRRDQIFEDIGAKEAAGLNLMNLNQQFERNIDEKKLTDADDLSAEANSIYGNINQNALDTRIQTGPKGEDLPGNNFGSTSGALFPSGSATLSIDTENLLNATGY